jgi:hypothetical protein
MNKMNANTYPSPAGYQSSYYIPQNRPYALLRTAHATGVSGMETVTHLMKSLRVPDHRKYQDFQRQIVGKNTLFPIRPKATGEGHKLSSTGNKEIVCYGPENTVYATKKN